MSTQEILSLARERLSRQELILSEMHIGYAESMVSKINASVPLRDELFSTLTSSLRSAFQAVQNTYLELCSCVGETPVTSEDDLLFFETEQRLRQLFVLPSP